MTMSQDASLQIMLERVRALKEKEKPARGKSKFPGLQGIKPRNFCWIIKGQLAASERPGGASKRHRRVRRDEELIWILESDITRILSLLPQTHNLKAYTDFGIPATNIPILSFEDLKAKLPQIFEIIDKSRSEGEVLLIHMDEFSDALAGLLAGYLLHAGLCDRIHQATAIIERIIRRPLGPDAKTVAAFGAPQAQKPHPRSRKR